MHPVTIQSMAYLAATYHRQGQPKEAEEINVKVLKLQKEALGEMHPDTIRSTAELVATYYQQCRQEEAKELEVLIVNTRIS